MIITKNHIFQAIFLLLSFNSLFSQELPPITKYSQIDYSAGTQNWMISQDSNHFLFFANNDGLLEFNGSEWTLYPSPNETIIRSVKVVNDRIYTGCYMEFGYWFREENNQLKYVSLSAKIKSKIVDDEQFWNIINYEQWIVFQSLNNIYIFNIKTETFKIISPKNPIIKSYHTKNSIYFQVANEGLFEIENGKSKLVTKDNLVVKNKIVAVFNSNEGLLIQTQDSGFITFINGKINQVLTEENEIIASSSVYSCLELSDKSYVIGTISNGIFIINSNGKIKYHIKQTSGLSNNTILSLFEDIDNNLWIGLDNGIDCVNLKSPIKTYIDHTGSLGTVYTSLVNNGKLYIGTNQGLFCKRVDSKDDFKFISGTKGQVWSIFNYDGVLFCGHDSGTFIIENDISKKIYSASGTWKFSTIPGRSDMLLQGNYFGISVLKKENNEWKFKNKISGFNYSSKYFEILNGNDIYVSHEYKGVFRVTFDKNFLKASGVYTYDKPTKGRHAGLIKFKNTIYYANKEGIFKLDTDLKKFNKDEKLSAVLDNNEYLSGKLIADKSNKMWLFTKNYIYYFTMNKLSVDLKQNSIPIPSSLTNSMAGYENISQLSNSDYLVGTADGYYTINLNDLNFNNHNISISSILIDKLDGNSFLSSLKNEGEFDHDENNITFHYTVPDYNKYIYTEYQYVLEGLHDNWSNWSSSSSVNFINLAPGKYIFKVRAKIANSNTENISTYTFYINNPWYATIWAKIIYFILFLIVFFYINKLYTNYHEKKHEKIITENNLLLELKELENQKELMKLKNEKLNQDMDLKNKELAVSTMNLIKKTELLNIIKDDLNSSTNAESSRSIKSIISTITKNVKEEDTWNIFKEAFDNADKDFIKNVKILHPNLTPNDLRLCAYLRLNLSSKEIAPLINISVRSVEIKRYRLRKKMDLPHEQGLVEYILSI